jgi:hypothetical protein
MKVDQQALYAAPKTRDGAEPIDVSPEITAARLAGGLITIAGLVFAGSTLFSLIPKRGLLLHSPPALIGQLAPIILSSGLTVLLAIPLLRGSRRFRVLTLARAALAPLSALAVKTAMYLSPRLAEALHWNWNAGFVEDCLFCVAIFVLLVGRPGRARLLVGGALAVLDILVWLALRFGLLAL